MFPQSLTSILYSPCKRTRNLSTNFLDVTFDLTHGTYKPYRKPNDKPLYINCSSIHPPSILQELPHSINKRINTLSCDKQTFDTTAQEYNDALKQSNFNTRLNYQTQNTNDDSRRNRTRNVLWYNHPYSKNASTNIARTFLQLIDKQFSPTNKLHKLFNLHTVRVSYSCRENTKSFISTHNKTILRRQWTRPENRKDKHELHTKLKLQTY